MVQSKHISSGATNSGAHTESKYKPRMTMYDSQTAVVPSRQSKTHKHLKRKETSTWKVESRTIPEYTTEKGEKYVNPKYRAVDHDLIPPQDPEAQRRNMRANAVKKFQAVATKRYGSVEKLFQAVIYSYITHFR